MAPKDSSTVQSGSENHDHLQERSCVPVKVAGSNAEHSMHGSRAAELWRGYNIPKKIQSHINVGLESGSENNEARNPYSQSDDKRLVYSEQEYDTYENADRWQASGIPKVDNFT